MIVQKELTLVIAGNLQKKHSGKSRVVRTKAQAMSIARDNDTKRKRVVVIGLKANARAARPFSYMILF